MPRGRVIASPERPSRSTGGGNAKSRSKSRSTSPLSRPIGSNIDFLNAISRHGSHDLHYQDRIRDIGVPQISRFDAFSLSTPARDKNYAVQLSKELDELYQQAKLKAELDFRRLRDRLSDRTAHNPYFGEESGGDRHASAKQNQETSSGGNNEGFAKDSNGRSQKSLGGQTQLDIEIRREEATVTEMDHARKGEAFNIEDWVNNTGGDTVAARLCERSRLEERERTRIGAMLRNTTRDEEEMGGTRDRHCQFSGKEKVEGVSSFSGEKKIEKEDTEVQSLDHKGHGDGRQMLDEGKSKHEHLDVCSFEADTAPSLTEQSQLPSQKPHSRMDVAPIPNPLESAAVGVNADSNLSSAAADRQDMALDSGQQYYKIGTARIRIQLLSLTSNFQPSLGIEIDQQISSADGSSSDDQNNSINVDDASVNCFEHTDITQAAGASDFSTHNCGQTMTGCSGTDDNSLSQNSSSNHNVRGSDGTHGDDENGDRSGSGRGESDISRERNDCTDTRRFACPYQAYDKTRLCLRPGPRNPGGGCESIKRLRQHLKRCHTRGSRCQLCWRKFDKQAERNEHIERRSCRRQDLPNTEILMTRDQERMISSCSIATTNKAVWWHLFKVLIPEMDSRSIASLECEYSPYYAIAIGIPSIPGLMFSQQPLLGDTSTLRLSRTNEADANGPSLTMSDAIRDASMFGGDPFSQFASDLITLDVYQPLPIQDGSISLFHNAANASGLQEMIWQPSAAPPPGGEVSAAVNLAGSLLSSTHRSETTETTGNPIRNQSDQSRLQDICNRLQRQCSSLQRDNAELRSNQERMIVSMSDILSELQQILIEEHHNIASNAWGRLGTLHESISNIHSHPR